ncbi:MAG: ABC transporter permease, partial [Bdellovibrionota bacterium]
MSGDLFCVGKKFLVFNLVARNLKVKYRRSVFGIFWTLLSPLAMATVFYFVFKIILQVTIPHYLVFVLSGMLPWTFFAQTVMEGLESIVGNGSLITKVPVPTHVFPFVGTVTNLITLVLALPILILVAIISEAPIGGPPLLLGVYVFALFFITYGVSLLAAVAFVYFRD